MRIATLAVVMLATCSCGGRTGLSGDEHFDARADDAALRGDYQVAFLAPAPGGISLWHSRDGSVTPLLTSAASDPALTPDGHFLAISTVTPSGVAVYAISGHAVWSRELESSPAEVYNYRPTLRSDGQLAIASATCSTDGGSNPCLAWCDSAASGFLSDTTAKAASYSADDVHLVFESSYQIVFARSDLSEQTVLATADSGDRSIGDPSISFDGKRVTYARCLQASKIDSCEIDVVEVDTKATASVTAHDSWKRSPHFTPDGSAIVYVDNDVGTSGSYEVRRVDLTTHAITTIAPTGTGAFEPPRIALSLDPGQ